MTRYPATSLLLFRLRGKRGKRGKREKGAYRAFRAFRAPPARYTSRGRPCKVCRRAVATEVHYQTWGRVGSEPLWELRAVCCACHARLHPEEDR